MFTVPESRDPKSAARLLPADEVNFSSFDNPPSLWPNFLEGQVARPVRVVVVDQDPSIRRRVAHDLMADPRTLFIAEAATLREARRLVRDTEFDVLLADVTQRDGAGYELIAYTRNLKPNAQIIAVSAVESDEKALRAIQLGAVGFLAKNSWFGSYVQAVLQVANGGASLSPTVARRLLLKLDGPEAAAAGDSPVPTKLSDREQQVLRMIAEGFNSSEIGMRLTISRQTVNAHVKNIYRKLHVRSRAQAVSCAKTWGLF